MNESDIRRLMTIELLGIMFFVILFVFFDGLPAIRTIIQLREDIRLTKMGVEAIPQVQREAQKEKLRTDIHEIKNKFEVVKKEFTTLQKKVINEKNIPLITQEIVALADSCQIDLALVKPLALRTYEQYEVVPTDLQFKCTYAELIPLVVAIDNSPLLVGIDRFEIKRVKEEYPQLAVNMTVAALFKSGTVTSASSTDRQVK